MLPVFVAHYRIFGFFLCNSFLMREKVKMLVSLSRGIVVCFKQIVVFALMQDRVLLYELSV